MRLHKQKRYGIQVICYLFLSHSYFPPPPFRPLSYPTLPLYTIPFFSSFNHSIPCHYHSASLFALLCPAHLSSSILHCIFTTSSLPFPTLCTCIFKRQCVSYQLLRYVHLIVLTPSISPFLLYPLIFLHLS